MRVPARPSPWHETGWLPVGRRLQASGELQRPTTATYSMIERLP